MLRLSPPGHPNVHKKRSRQQPHVCEVTLHRVPRIGSIFRRPHISKLGPHLGSRYQPARLPSFNLPLTHGVLPVSPLKLPRPHPGTPTLRLLRPHLRTAMTLFRLPRHHPVNPTWIPPVPDMVVVQVWKVVLHHKTSPLFYLMSLVLHRPHPPDSSPGHPFHPLLYLTS
jgi:hypothetical protein